MQNDECGIKKRRIEDFGGFMSPPSALGRFSHHSSFRIHHSRDARDPSSVVGASLPS